MFSLSFRGSFKKMLLRASGRGHGQKWLFKITVWCVLLNSTVHQKTIFNPAIEISTLLFTYWDKHDNHTI